MCFARRLAKLNYTKPVFQLHVKVQTKSTFKQEVIASPKRIVQLEIVVRPSNMSFDY